MLLTPSKTLPFFSFAKPVWLVLQKHTGTEQQRWGLQETSEDHRSGEKTYTLFVLFIYCIWVFKKNQFVYVHRKSLWKWMLHRERSPQKQLYLISYQGCNLGCWEPVWTFLYWSCHSWDFVTIFKIFKETGQHSDKYTLCAKLGWMHGPIFVPITQMKLISVF